MLDETKKKKVMLKSSHYLLKHLRCPTRSQQVLKEQLLSYNELLWITRTWRVVIKLLTRQEKKKKKKPKKKKMAEIERAYKKGRMSLLEFHTVS
jgi:hypothetical protein